MAETSTGNSELPDRGLTVLFLQPHLTSTGGGTKFVLESARAIKAFGMNAVIVAQSGREEIYGPYEKDLEFMFIGGPLPKNVTHWVELPSLIRRCEAAVRKSRPDILFVHVFPANWWGYLIRKRFPRIPCVWYCHDPNSFINDLEVIRGLDTPMRYLALAGNPVARLTDHWLTRRADYILANSRFTASRIKQIYGRDSIVVYPGVDTTRFKPVPSHKKHIFSAGQWTYWKRLDLLIDALHILKRESATGSTKLRIAGEGREIDALTDRTRRLGLEDDVQFLGHLSEEELAQEYASALLVVYPSPNEPFGLVPLEAMASGTPALVSSSGGTAETVIHGVTGAHFKEPTPLSLARELRSLLDDRGRLISMGGKARDRVYRKFSWVATARILSESLNEIAHAWDAQVS